MTEYCEEELIIGSTTVFCLCHAGHEGDCIFADPKVIEIMADRTCEVK